MLSGITFTREEGIFHHEVDCFKEECAWWDDVKERCVIVTVGFGLGVVAELLKEVREKLPSHGRLV